MTETEMLGNGVFWEKVMAEVEKTFELPEGVVREKCTFTHSLEPGNDYPILATTISMNVYGNPLKLLAKLQLVSVERV